MLRVTLLVALALPVLPAGAPEREPDFYLMMQKCSTTVGYLVLSDASLKTVEGTPALNTCTRNGKSISCMLEFKDGSPPKRAEYEVDLDSPPMLYFMDSQHGDWIAVDTAAHAAVVITRIVGEKYVGSKVCHGMFATQSEMTALQKRK
jgi:hypothetical protein